MFIKLHDTKYICGICEEKNIFEWPATYWGGGRLDNKQLNF